MPIKPKDSRLVGFNRVKPRLQRLPKRKPIPLGVTLARDDKSSAELAYNPPASSPNPLITPTSFLPEHLRKYREPEGPPARMPPALTKEMQKTLLTSEQIEEVRALRSSGTSVNEIARKFSTSSLFVSLVAPLSKQARKQVAQQDQAERSLWSERKQVFAQIRQNKRETWGF